MATIRIMQRKEQDLRGNRGILVVYSHSSRRTKISTGVSVHPDYLDIEGERVLARPKGKKGRQRAYAYSLRDTDKIRSTIDKIERAVARCNLDRVEPDVDRVKKLVKAGDAVIESPSFSTVAQDYLRTRERSGTKSGTLDLYTAAIKKVVSIYPDLKIIEMDLGWRDRFNSALKASRSSQNTRSVYLSALAAILSDAHLLGIETAGQHSGNGKWSVAKVKPDTFYLHREELDALEAVQLDSVRSYHRDHFLFACYTGLRISDVSRVRPEMIDLKAGILRLSTKKTEVKIVVPLGRKSVEILQRYGLKLHVNGCSANKGIKVAAKAAGLTRKVSATRGRVGEVELHQAVSFHTARRTFATLGYLAGVDIGTLIQITGHSTEQEFRRYLRLEGEINARNALGHPYFQ